MYSLVFICDVCFLSVCCFSLHGFPWLNNNSSLGFHFNMGFCLVHTFTCFVTAYFRLVGSQVWSGKTALGTDFRSLFDLTRMVNQVQKPRMQTTNDRHRAEFYESPVNPVTQEHPAECKFRRTGLSFVCSNGRRSCAGIKKDKKRRCKAAEEFVARFSL